MCKTRVSCPSSSELVKLLLRDRLYLLQNIELNAWSARGLGKRPSVLPEWLILYIFQNAHQWYEWRWDVAIGQIELIEKVVGIIASSYSIEEYSQDCDISWGSSVNNVHLSIIVGGIYSMLWRGVEVELL